MIVEALVIEVRRLAQQVVEAMYVPVDKRLWRRLVEMTTAFGADDAPATDIPITQDVLAQLERLHPIDREPHVALPARRTASSRSTR